MTKTVNSRDLRPLNVDTKTPGRCLCTSSQLCLVIIFNFAIRRAGCKTWRSVKTRGQSLRGQKSAKTDTTTSGQKTRGQRSAKSQTSDTKKTRSVRTRKPLPTPSNCLRPSVRREIPRRDRRSEVRGQLKARSRSLRGQRSAKSKP